MKPFLSALFVLFSLSVGAQTLPPTPATCTAAVEQSNLFAYNGRAKNTPDYWCPMYDKDPLYFWKRMLGWQAGGDDAPLSGAYANPPSPWFGSVIIPPPQPPQPPPAPLPSVDLTPVMNQLAQCIAEVQNLGVQVRDVNNQVQEGRRENQSFFAKVGSEWKRILTYAGPIVGAIFLGKGLGQ